MNKIRAITIEFTNGSEPIKLTYDELKAVVETFAPLFGYMPSIIVYDNNGDKIEKQPLNWGSTNAD